MIIKILSKLGADMIDTMSLLSEVAKQRPIDRE